MNKWNTWNNSNW